ncbi:MAG: hypothetical protein Q4A21_02035 [bacterium]|nr:hypothetical protein [bacterium]
MSSAAEILVVILSIFLAIFIALGIVTFILIIRVSKQIGDVAENFRNISNGVDNVVQNIAQISSPIIIGKAMIDIFKNLKKKGEKNE